MKKYEALLIERVELSEQDVITTSGDPLFSEKDNNAADKDWGALIGRD